MQPLAGLVRSNDSGQCQYSTAAAHRDESGRLRTHHGVLLVLTPETTMATGWPIEGPVSVWRPADQPRNPAFSVLLPIPPRDLNELFGMMRRDDPAVCDERGEWSTELPVFGGAEPEDTHRVWSWDRDRLIVGTCADDLEIVSRS